MYKTKIRFKTTDDDKIIKSKEPPEITCEMGFMRFWFPDPEETILVNAEVILTVSCSEIEEIQAGPKKATLKDLDNLEDLFPDANAN